jgi:tRNA (guanine10-N2)-dimethyltransferase
MKIFQLSKSNIELAKHEVLSFAKTKHFEIYDNLLITDAISNFYSRLGYTNAVYELLFKCRETELEKEINNFNWNAIYEENFFVRTIGKENSRELGSKIFNKLKNPIVKAKNTRTEIFFFYKENLVFTGHLIYKSDKSYLKRKAHLRPEMHPTSLNPGLAKACINLTGLSRGNLLDPFCGSGGILIEAGLMGFNVTGYDIDEKQIKRANINLKSYEIKDFLLEVKNALSLNKKYDCIVTDLPYGKNSKVDNLKETYFSFLKKSEKTTKNMVIIFPDFSNPEKIIKKTNWKIKTNISQYIHKSMTKEIFSLVLPSH